MKSTILFYFLFIICFGSYSHAQIFVDDVDKVAEVVIDYCVDGNGKVYDVEINLEKTTYKNIDWQNSVLSHFKKGKLNSPMKMTNQCWGYVYYFVNEKYKKASLSDEDKIKCKKFRKGKFKYNSSVFNEGIIKRRKNKQIEIFSEKNNRQVYKIEWKSDNIYILTSTKLKLEKDKSKIGVPIFVEIIELINNDSYLYKAHFVGKEEFNYGIMYKLD